MVLPHTIMAKQETNSEVNSKLYQNLLKVLKQFLMGKGYEPLTMRSLFSRLSFPKEHIPLAKEALAQLAQEKYVQLKDRRYHFIGGSKQPVVTGVIRVHPKGFGFVQPELNEVVTQDVFIPKHLTKNAVDGDTVEALVNTEANHSRGPEGRIISILERGRTHLAGSIVSVSRMEITAYAPLLGVSHEVHVEPSKEHVFQEGDRIIMKVLEWGSQHTPTRTQMSHYIGHISDPSCDLRAIIEEYGLKKDFPTKVLKEVKAFGTRVHAGEIRHRKDYRDEISVTIDPDTAKDFDDAITISKNKDGTIHLIVHIADVSHYVHEGSQLDLEASLRCNSTYFPSYVLPMLPHELSSHLCSLKPNVNRLAISVSMSFDKEGVLTSYSIDRSVIRSKKRFTYKEARDVLDGKKSSPYKEQLELMVELTGLLKKHRFQRGSVEFALPELVILVDENGEPSGVEKIEYDITHQMVEEFMLKTNEVIARHMNTHKKFIPYRIHEGPGEDDLQSFVRLGRAFGFSIEDRPSGEDVQALFESAKGTQWEQQLAVAFIKSMRLAYYSADNIGHYGLCLDLYCHFTSPIRRYVDLMIHRALFQEEQNLEKLEVQAENCSTQERVSARAESTLKLLKKLRYLGQIIDTDPYREFEAIVTKVKPFGIYFEVLDVTLEGFLHVSELESDFFVYQEPLNRLRGERTGKRYQCGTHLTVHLSSVNFLTLESEWYVVNEEKSNHFKRKKRRQRKRK